MRLLYVWDADYPWDVRTEKVCRAFSGAGWDVTIAARNKNGAARTESLTEGFVERIPLPPFLGARGRAALSFPAFVNPLWLWHIGRTVSRNQVDLVIVRDLPLALTAMAAARGRPVILDMAENYPAMIQDVWSDGAAKPLDFLIRNPTFVRAVERWVVAHVDHIVTVVEESSSRLQALGVPADRLTVVSNTPPLTQVAGQPMLADPDPLQVVYLGLMEGHRGVTDLLEATRLLAGEGVRLQVDFVGGGRDLPSFRQQAEAAGLRAPVVRFHGQVSHAEALDLMRRNQVGVIPHHPRESWNTTIPNKLFDYMAAGLAVVSSNAIPAERVVRETGTGLIYKGGDPGALAASLRRMTDRSQLDAYRMAGQVAVRTKYNWSLDSTKLLKLATNLVGNPRDVVRGAP